MLRLTFIIVASLPIMGTLMALIRLGFVPASGTPFVIAGITDFVVVMVGYYVFLDRVRPKADLTRVKVRLSENGDVVLSVIPFGIKFGGREAPDYRMYRARVREPDGTETNHTVAVEATWLGGGPILNQHHRQRSLSDIAGGATPDPSMTGFGGLPTRPSWKDRE